MKDLNQKMLNRLVSIKGRSFMYRADTIHVVDYRPEGGKVTIVTDKKWFDFSYEKIEGFLNELLPVEQDAENERGMLMVRQAKTTTSSINELRTVLMNSIEQVQKSKDYIPQAQEINSNVKSIIDIAKTEIEVLKILKS